MLPRALKKQDTGDGEILMRIECGDAYDGGWPSINAV
jgi:hypothetical protein